MAKFRFNRKVNVNRVVKKVAATLLGLYVGGTLLNAIGTVINGTTSPFYNGLAIIGYTVNGSNHITSTSGTGGVLTIVGIAGFASVVMEFVSFSL